MNDPIPNGAANDANRTLPTADPGPQPVNATLPRLKNLPAGAAARMFPPHGKRIEKAINKRFAPILGRAIDGRRLYHVLRNLGSTDPQIFIDWLNRESYEILGRSGSYAHLPGLARRCAIFAAAGAATPTTTTPTTAAVPQTRQAGS